MSKSIIYKDPSNYFEAIIQLRPYDEEIFNFLKKRIRKRDGVFITKVIQLKTGIDIYISSQRYARRLGQDMKKAFKGELKITRKLHTQSRETSKLLYRATVLFRLKPKEED
jgi:nonsense-mediated mRNA decay protein 3